MRFDWLTWLIWAIGLAIFILWIIYPVKEFISLMRERIKK